MIHPRERYTVNHPKGFVCCKLGVAELKLEHSFALTGDGEIHVSANDSISAFWGDDFFVGREDGSSVSDTRFGTPE